MSMAWVRKSYGVPAKRGMRVEYTGDGKTELGTIKSASSGRLNIQLDGVKHTTQFHPTWKLRYITATLEASMSEEQDLMAVINWLAGDDRGLSSENIACHMVGLHERVSGFTPSDPDDLGRCLRLLERFPQWKPRMSEMTRHGKEWAALMPHWDELAQVMADEVGIDWSKGNRAPRTYEAMHRYADESRNTHD